MKRFSMMWVVAGAMALQAPAWAGDAADGTSLALSRIALDPATAVAIGVVPPATRTPEDAIVAGGASSGDLSYAVRRGHVLNSIRWEPRPWRKHAESQPSAPHEDTGFSHIYAGAYDPDGDLGPGFLCGIRGGATVDNNFQLGVGVDWVHKSDRQTALVSTVPLPGGGTSERRLDLASSSQDLIPFMALLQLSLGSGKAAHPYFGIAGGWEALLISAEDFTTGNQFDATYGGWGWQAWAGLAIPVSSKGRINGEILRNTAKVERDVADEITGEKYREIVNEDGVGVRFGLSWGF